MTVEYHLLRAPLDTDLDDYGADAEPEEVCGSWARAAVRIAERLAAEPGLRAIACAPSGPDRWRLRAVASVPPGWPHFGPLPQPGCDPAWYDKNGAPGDPGQWMWIAVRGLPVIGIGTASRGREFRLPAALIDPTASEGSVIVARRRESSKDRRLGAVCDGNTAQDGPADPWIAWRP